jgi:hypothetical protein
VEFDSYDGCTQGIVTCIHEAGDMVQCSQQCVQMVDEGSETTLQATT